MKLRSYLQSFFGLPLTLIAFAFIGKVFYDNRVEIFSTLKSADLLLLLIGTIFFAVFFAIKAYVWTLILEKRGFESKKRATVFAYSLAEIKRYIPGGIFAVIGRLNIKTHEISKKETLKGIGIEAILLASSALLVSMPALYYAITKLNSPLVYLLNMAVMVLTLTCVVIAIKYRKHIFSYFNHFLLFVLAWIFYGIGSLFTLISFGEINPTFVLTVISIFTLSWLIGYLFFIAPMGLGVREVANTYLLSLVIPFPLATAVAIFSRINMILGELMFLIASYFMASIRENSKFLKIDRHFLLVIIFAVIYFITFTSFSFIRHDRFLSGRFDLGNMTQTVWNTANGNFFMLTNPDGVENVSRLAVHSDFILILIAPLYWLWSDPKILLIVQTAVLSIGGIYVFLISKSILKNRNISVILALSYYLNFWLHEQNLFDFHAVTLATTFLLGAFYYLINKRYFLFFLFLTLAVITKENVFLLSSGFGLYFIFKEKKLIPGIIITLIPFFIFYFISSFAIPAARGGLHFALGSYSYLGASLNEVILNIFLKPQIVFSQLFNVSTLNYLFNHLFPTGFLALLSPFYLLFTIPDIAIYLLSSNYEYRSYEYHFGALFIPFIFISTIYGVGLLKKRFGVRIHHFLFYYILGFALLSMYLYSPLPGMLRADYGLFSNLKTDTIKKYISLIPPDASVAATNNIGAHLSHRKYIYVVPFGINEADFIVLFGEDGRFKDLVDTFEYENLVIDETNNFYLYKKRIKITCSSCLP